MLRNDKLAGGNTQQRSKVKNINTKSSRFLLVNVTALKKSNICSYNNICKEALQALVEIALILRRSCFGNASWDLKAEYTVQERQI